MIELNLVTHSLQISITKIKIRLILLFQAMLLFQTQFLQPLTIIWTHIVLYDIYYIIVYVTLTVLTYHGNLSLISFYLRALLSLLMKFKTHKFWHIGIKYCCLKKLKKYFISQKQIDFDKLS